MGASNSFQGKFAIVTGGSSGIGLCVAEELYQRGCNVIIVARNEQKLQQAINHINQGKTQSTMIDYVTCDVTDIKQVQQSMLEACVKMKVTAPDILICNAGSAECGTIIEADWQQFRSQTDLNYLGQVSVIQALVKQMKERKSGHIVIVGSGLSLMGIYGMITYVPTKFALRGLALSLYYDLLPYNIKVSIAYPPDTDTPGLAQENQTKSRITQKLSESGGLVAPRQVALSIVNGIEKNKFVITSDCMMCMLAYYTWDFTPESCCHCCGRCFVMPLGICIAYCLNSCWRRTILKEAVWVQAYVPNDALYKY